MSEISDLMAKDPLSLTVEDVTSIVAHFRENRERYVAGVKPLKTEKLPKPAKGSVDLGDLDIQL